jgi:hypothetical protein
MTQYVLRRKLTGEIWYRLGRYNTMIEAMLVADQRLRLMATCAPWIQLTIQNFDVIPIDDECPCCGGDGEISDESQITPTTITPPTRPCPECKGK